MFNEIRKGSYFVEHPSETTYFVEKLSISGQIRMVGALLHTRLDAYSSNAMLMDCFGTTRFA